MSNIPTLDQLMSTSISDLMQYSLLEVGEYHAVITNVEARDGAKAPYLNIEVTIHARADGNEECRGRKVWRNVSFSEKAIGMPAGVAQLVQATQPSIPTDVTPDGMPGAIAVAISGVAIGVNVGHEEGYDSKAVDNIKRDDDGEVIMRESIDGFFTAPDSFTEAFEAEAAGNDSDLPF